jgi:endo-1,4-beta-xylanase
MPLVRRFRPSLTLACLVAAAAVDVAAQTPAPARVPPAPLPQSVPAPAAPTNAPYQPQSILQGGIVVPLFPPDSPLLKADRLKEPEVYSMTNGTPGRIASIVGIHNPSIEFHGVPASLNTGAVVILAPGGGHNFLNVGSEGSDFVPFFYNYGVNTVILRNRLRRDGYNPQTDEVYDAQQAIRMVRARAEEWKIDPRKIGIMGFSAGAELAAPAGLAFEAYERAHADASDPLAGVSARPDFVALVYPGPTPFARDPDTPIPANAPPTFLVCAGSGDAQHAIWADQYFAAFLRARIPDLEMHIYATGRHPGDPLPDGSSMSGGLTDRNGTPFGTWQLRLVDWMRDLGFLQKPGVETKAARDVATRVAQPPRAGRGGAPAATPAPAPAGR